MGVVSGTNFDLSLLFVSCSERRHGSTIEYQAMPSRRDGDLYTFSSWKPVDLHCSLSASLHVCLYAFLLNTCQLVYLSACLYVWLSACCLSTYLPVPVSLLACPSFCCLCRFVLSSFSVCLYISTNLKIILVISLSQINMCSYCFFRPPYLPVFSFFV